MLLSIAPTSPERMVLLPDGRMMSEGEMMIRGHIAMHMGKETPAPEPVAEDQVAKKRAAKKAAPKKPKGS